MCVGESSRSVGRCSRWGGAGRQDDDVVDVHRSIDGSIDRPTCPEPSPPCRSTHVPPRTSYRSLYDSSCALAGSFSSSISVSVSCLYSLREARSPSSCSGAWSAGGAEAAAVAIHASAIPCVGWLLATCVAVAKQDGECLEWCGARTCPSINSFGARSSHPPSMEFERGGVRFGEELEKAAAPSRPPD